MKRRVASMLTASLAALILLVPLAACQEVQLDVVGLNAQVSSFKIPYHGVWVETGPITISLSDVLAREYTTKLDLESGVGEIVWPVRFSCPFFHETGIGEVDTLFVGTIHLMGEGLAACFDVAYLEIAEVGHVVVCNKNNINIRVEFLRDPLDDPIPLQGGFVNATPQFFREYEYGLLCEDLHVAGEMLTDLTGNDFSDVGFDVDRALSLYAEMYPPYEIVVYFAQTDTFATADLVGEVVLWLAP